MAFLVEKTHNNGYRCGCCHQSWTSSEWFDSREDALAEVPRTHEQNGDSELEAITVTDGAANQVIASMRLSWYGGRGERYQHQVWRGEIDGAQIDDLRGNLPGETYEQMATRLHKQALEAKLAKTEAEVARLRAEADLLKKQL